MNNRTITALSILCVLIFFAFDLYIELGVAGGVTYVIAILLLSFQDNKRMIWYIAILTSLLTLLGLFYSPSGGETYKVITNRFLAFFIIWGTSFLVVKYISLQSQLSKTKSMLLFKGIDNQQKRIATELHESSVQLITVANSLIKFHINKIKREKETGKYSEINEVSLILESAILELKNISYELQPSVLNDFGLLAGIN